LSLVLYEHQDKLVSDTRAAMRRVRSVLMQSCTGSGKTAMAAHVVARANEKGKRVWFTVPRRELITQTAKTLERLDLPYSYIAAGYSTNPYARTQICSVDTLRGRLAGLTPPDLAIVDETHYGAAALDHIIKWLKASGAWIVGLSATPWKASGEGLGKWYDEMVQGPSISWLIENEYLSKFKAYAPSTPDFSGIKIVGGDYAKGQIASYMEQDRVLIGDAVRHYRQHAMGRLNIAYCTSRKHSEITAAQFRDAGIPTAHIDGETPDDERRRIIRAFAKRELLVLTSVDLLTFGFDLSAQAGFDVTVESLSDLRPTKSLALQCQKWGRVLRKKDYHAIIFDHSNNIRQFGLPDADREWTLADRERAPKGDGNCAMPVRQCTECFFCHRPAPVCPSCGFTYPIQSREVEHLDGELTEISADPLRSEKAMKQKLYSLIGLAKQRGYANPEAWAAKIISQEAARGRGA
jgi:DNA repair protein RadD